MPRLISFLFDIFGILAGVLFALMVLMVALFLAGTTLIGMREAGFSLGWAKAGACLTLFCVVLAAMTISDMISDFITWWARRDIKNLEGDE